MDQASNSAANLTKKKEKALAKVGEISSQIDKLSFSEAEYNQLEQEKTNLNAAVSVLRETVETLSAQLEARLRFKYSDPVRGFDRSKVKGLVAKLVSVRRTEHVTALEVVAGGKLYQVVVDEAITGKALLSHGKLERRVTIIPIDKIKSRRVPAATSDRASDIAAGMGSTSAPAIDLVGFDEEVRTAMEYVFGSTLVVDGMKAANHICDVTKTRTVTYDGDVYDPSGTISGGSKHNLGSTLSKLTEFSEAQKALNEKDTRLTTVEAQLRSMKNAFSKFETFNEKLELAQAELAGVEKHLSQTKFGMISEKHDAMTKDIVDAEAEITEMEREKEEKWALYQELQSREQELTNEREEKLAQIHQSVHDAKRIAVEKTKQAREAESRDQTLRLELQSVKAELVAAEEAVGLAEKALKEANNAESELQMKVGEANSRYEEAKAQLDDLEDRMTHFSSELGELKACKDDLQRNIDLLELEAKKMKVSIAKIEKDRANAEKFVFSMIKRYSWIDTEKAAFGVPGGDYDFASVDVQAMKSQLEDLKSEQDALAKKINKKVMGMIEKAEAEYTELLRKRKVVENDKKKIQAVIEELDVKKKTELERTWVKVTRDFGSIFSTLLPGAFAKLEPPEGMQAWEGLEVKVAFGDVWKESLSELSGGQRSLLALSLILSLLLFKPAPMYILDEVDAALDLSHTQNIGSMLKTHFSQSQFIVVSLKEGMFNNANVIFRTKFVDGVSAVTRTIGTGSSVRARALAETDSNEMEFENTSIRKRPAAGKARRSNKENHLN
jgi:structural maintenance of chromosome 2